MSTIIYPSPIFGPVHIRRLGISLGINLMPSDGKICTFDCIYCECGFNADYKPKLPRPTRTEVAEALERQLIKMTAAGQLPDVLTFAGNGEPTAHPAFPEIISDTVDMTYIRKVDRPNQPSFDIERVIEQLIRFKGHVIIQTMFMKGTTGGLHPESVDNTGEEYVKPWLDAVKRIAPGQVMIYTIDRETPTSGLLKATPQQLDSIRDRVIAAGIPCSASY